VTLPTITVEARSPAFDPAFEINSVTVLDRDTLARLEERNLNGVFRGFPASPCKCRVAAARSAACSCVGQAPASDSSASMGSRSSARSRAPSTSRPYFYNSFY
jgi:hypothetical protein